MGFLSVSPGDRCCLSRLLPCCDEIHHKSSVREEDCLGSWLSLAHHGREGMEEEYEEYEVTSHPRMPALGTVSLTFSVNLPPQLILEVSS